MLEKESEEIRPKYFPCIIRPGKRLLLFLVILNLFIIWLFYDSSRNLTHFGLFTKSSAANVSEASLSNLSLYHLPPLGFKDMTPYYKEVKSNVWCFLRGTDMDESKRRQKCVCVNQWYGLDCGIPDAVWKSSYLQGGKNGGVEIRRRKYPRRLISSIVSDDELDLLDINVRDTFSLIDIYLIAEENNSAPSLLNEFQKGFLSGFQQKIMPIKIKVDVQLKKERDWVVEMLHQLWSIGWERVSDFRPDDIFLFSHVSSIVSKDVLLFLKLYDGYPEPFYFELRPLLFQFQNQIMSNISLNDRFIPFNSFGCTFQYIASLCRFDILKLFNKSCITNEKRNQEKKYESNFWKVKEWTIGNNVVPSGWHCNLCCQMNCIKNILTKKKWLSANFSTSALENKFTNMSVIKNLLKNQKWFDTTEFNIKKLLSTDLFYAPSIAVKNYYKYSHLI